MRRLVSRKRLAALEAKAAFTIEPDEDGFMSLTNTPLSARTAVPVVWACVNVVANAIALAPWRLRGRDGQVLEEHRAYATLNRPYPYSPRQVKRTVTEQLLYKGNAYILAQPRQGTSRALIPALDGEMVSDGMYQLRLLGFNDEVRMAPSSRVVAMHGPLFDGKQSPSPIKAAAMRALKTLDSSSRRVLEAMDSGLHNQVVLSFGDAPMVGPQEMAQLTAELSKLSTGYARDVKRNKIPILPPGVKPEVIDTVSPQDLRIIELFGWTVEDVCRVWHVPPRMIGHYSAALRVRGVEAQAEDFARWTVAPVAQLIAEEVQRVLAITDATLELDLSDLALGSLAERATVARALSDILYINERRTIVRRGPIPDGDRIAPSPSVNPGPDPTTDPDEGTDNDDEQEV